MSRETKCWLSPLPCWCPGVAKARGSCAAMGTGIWNNPGPTSVWASARVCNGICGCAQAAYIVPALPHPALCSQHWLSLCSLSSFLHVLLPPTFSTHCPFSPASLCRPFSPCSLCVLTPSSGSSRCPSLPPYQPSTSCPLFSEELHTAVAPPFILWTHVSKHVP